MILPSSIRFADENRKEALRKLKTGDEAERKLFNAINNALKNIEKDAFYGTQIQKDRFPKEYIKKYLIENLWKVDLKDGWRIVYTIKRADDAVLSLIIEWFDHKGYNKRFKY